MSVKPQHRWRPAKWYRAVYEIRLEEVRAVRPALIEDAERLGYLKRHEITKELEQRRPELGRIVRELHDYGFSQRDIERIVGFQPAAINARLRE